MHHVIYDWRLYLVDDDVIQNNVPIPIRMTTWETSTCRLLHDMYWCSNIILPWCGDVTCCVVFLVLDISYPSQISSWYHRSIRVTLLLLQSWHTPKYNSAEHIDLWDWERERYRDWNTLQVHVRSFNLRLTILLCNHTLLNNLYLRLHWTWHVYYHLR